MAAQRRQALVVVGPPPGLTHPSVKARAANTETQDNLSHACKEKANAKPPQQASSSAAEGPPPPPTEAKAAPSGARTHKDRVCMRAVERWMLL